MIERAYKKLALDALVIQQGRLAEQKSKILFHMVFGYTRLLEKLVCLKYDPEWFWCSC